MQEFQILEVPYRHRQGHFERRTKGKKCSNEKKSLWFSTQGNETDVSSILGILCEVKQC